jgi:YgiT-type zinc finger domain-containing protein
MMDEELMAEVRSAMAQWRGTHPHATFAEIEQAVEEQIARIRVAMLEQVVADGPKQEEVICHACGSTMVRRSQSGREVTTQRDETVHLQRGYAVCPSCGTGLFPPG